MKKLYKCTPLTVTERETPYEIQEEKPTLLRAYKSQKLSFKIILQNLYWWICTKGKYRVWCAKDGERTVHTSYVVPRCKKFAFLEGEDYEIGPCATETSHRGKGIYPAVLYKIVAAREGTAYMVIEEDNFSSIRGVTKAGFCLQEGEVVRDKRKRYRYLPKDTPSL